MSIEEITKECHDEWVSVTEFLGITNKAWNEIDETQRGKEQALVDFLLTDKNELASAAYQAFVKDNPKGGNYKDLSMEVRVKFHIFRNTVKSCQQQIA